MGECAFLDPHVGMQVHLGRLGGFMAQPQRDDREVDAVPEQGHRGGVPQRMRGHLLGLQRRTRSRRGGGVAGDQPLHAIGGECPRSLRTAEI
jgi:hypothetical protein